MSIEKDALLQQFYSLPATQHYRWIVYGGYIRDTLLGIPPRDIDVLTNAPLEFVQTHFPNGDLRTNSIGQSVWYGQWRKTPFDIVLDEKKTAAYPCNDDDFRINLMGYDGFSFYDPWNGVRDIQDAILQTANPHSFKERLNSSPHSWFRFFRLIAMTGFSMNTTDRFLLKGMTDYHLHTPESHRTNEGYRLLNSPFPYHAVLSMQEQGLLPFTPPVENTPAVLKLKTPLLTQLFALELLTNQYTIDQFSRIYALPALLEEQRSLMREYQKNVWTSPDYFIKNELIRLHTKGFSSAIPI